MNRAKSLIAVGVILCLLLSSLTPLVLRDIARAQPADSAWPMFGQNPQRTGHSPFHGTGSPVLKWSFTTGGWVDSSPAIGADGTVYVGSADGKLYAINPDGTEKWSFTTGGAIRRSSPAIGAAGTIYVGSVDGRLYAINPEDGTEEWSFPTGGFVLSSPAIGADGTIYVGSWDNKLYAINPQDGNQKWSFTTGYNVFSSPAIGAAGTIYVGSFDYKLYAINPEGSEEWSFTTGGVVSSSPAIGADGTVYVGSDDGKLYAINPDDGSQKWSFTTGGVVSSSPAIKADGTIYVGSDDGKLYAINPDGSEKWSFPTGDRVDSSPAIGADGTVYVGSDDRKLYAINPDGTEKWSFTTGDRIASSPAIGVDTTIYVGSYDGKLYAIKAPYGLTISSTAGGSVVTPGEGAFTYDEGWVVPLVAEADEGYRFVGWTGDVATIADAGAARTWITMNDDCSIAANFARPPALATAGVTAITANSATLHMGFVVGDHSPVEVRFAYRQSADEEWSHTDWVSKTEEGGHAEPVTGLSPDTLYDYKAQMKYGSTEIEGAQLQFTTGTPSPAGGCFIATAAYGTPMAEEIQVLREFRDGYLLTSAPGQAFVSFYYRTSPPVAQFITDHPALKPVVRAALVPAVAMSTLVVNTTPAQKATAVGLGVLISVVLAMWATKRRGRGPEYS